MIFLNPSIYVSVTCISCDKVTILSKNDVVVLSLFSYLRSDIYFTKLVCVHKKRLDLTNMFRKYLFPVTEYHKYI